MKPSEKSFGDYSGLRSLQLGGKLRCDSNRIAVVTICLQFSWTDHTKYEPGSNSSRSRVGSFCNFSSFDRFLTSFAASSHSNHHLHCFIFPSPRLCCIPYSIVRSCGLPVVFSLHVNPQVRTVCGMPLWALFCCQPVAVSELGSWWLLGTGGMLYKRVWRVTGWAVGQ